MGEYSCAMCGASFDSDSDLAVHVQIAHVSRQYEIVAEN